MTPLLSSRRRLYWLPASFLFALLTGDLPIFGQNSVLTYHNDNMRTGQNLLETILTPISFRRRRPAITRHR